MNNPVEKSGERARTHAKLVAVFNQLLLAGEHGRPKVADVIATAGVARSTFYDHFDGIEALSNKSLEGLFSPLSDAILGTLERQKLQDLLTHVWENRALGRELLTGEKGERAGALLAQLIERRIDVNSSRRLSAILIAGTAISALGAWVSGRVNSTPEKLATALINSAEAILSEPG